MRARRGGWKVVCAPRAAVWHKGARNENARDVTRSYYLARNSLYFMRRHRPGLFPLAFVLSTRYMLLNHLVKGRWDHLGASLRGYRDFLMGRMGKGMEAYG